MAGSVIELAGEDVVGLRADNPGPLSLSGTNTWVVGREPAWVVDPGPELEPHVAAVAAEVARRGGLGGIALTHDHADHSEAIGALRERAGAAPLAAARPDAELIVAGGERAGPFEVLATPGHTPDHLAFVREHVAFTGDAVLGEGSVFVAADPGAMARYLDGLTRLRARQPALLCPGHGPPILDADAKLAEYLAHRRDRERRLIKALDSGLRSSDDLLDAVWDDAPPELRPVARVTLTAHLDKLAGEGRLPAGVERPR